MNIPKSIHRFFGSKKPYLHQTATIEPPVQAESVTETESVGIPEHLKERKEAVVFDEQTKQEAKKMGFFQKLKATLFPVKTPKSESVVPKEGEIMEKPVGKRTEAQEIKEAEKIYRQGVATIKDLIAPSSMEFMYDKMKVNSLMAKSFFVYAYPRYIEVNWLSPVINFDVSMDISMFMYPTSSAKIMKFLKNKVAQIQSTMRIEQEKGMVADPALETALQDAEELRRNIQRGEEKFFQYALYFTIYAEDEEKLKKIQTRLESALG
ncbi:hypothetical protein KKF04_00430, partial [Patescibacteria group bacterium]|nr:hypothetical protein [Patescibacteria group bacterium]